MKPIIKILSIALSLTLCVGHAQAKGNDEGFVRTSGIHFYKGNSTKPYYFMGTNMWYAPILGSKGEGGNRKRLCAELDSLKRIGVNNLRILVGADAGSKNANTVKPYLQETPGKLNENLLEGLDYTLQQMHKRGMVAVVYLTNSWDWSGGFGFYLKNAGLPDSPDSHGEGYNAYVDYAKAFYTNEKAKEMYYNFVKQIVTRKNAITGKPYAQDPTIMSWQLCNEPRPFGGREGQEAFVEWIRRTSDLIKALDPNHLISTGSEGVIGCHVGKSICCEEDQQLCTLVHGLDNIDYMTVHIWPANWGWATKDRLFDALQNVYLKTEDYLAQHDRIARTIDKPYVVEEFGYPRDHNFYAPDIPTQARDGFYQFIFNTLIDSKNNSGPMAGCNFWGWSGRGRAAADQWQSGADYLNDPPHEPQGWYSVYNTDSTTINIISRTAAEVNK